MPFGYVSPEQIMKDRADYARKGIARGRSAVVLAYDDGILFVAENLSRALHKVSEIYDRIAFAAVGKYNEFENLRIAGVRLADLRGYSYDRRDVTGRGLARRRRARRTRGTTAREEAGGGGGEGGGAGGGDAAGGDEISRLGGGGAGGAGPGFGGMGGGGESGPEGPDGRSTPRRRPPG